ncbi:MAG: kynureninase [Candidatus Promineifilaceae bacterium]
MTATDTYGMTYARHLDDVDILRGFRQKFLVEDPDLIYVDGNSLGRLPRATTELIRDVVEHQWGERLIRSWNEGWYDLPERVGAKLSKLIGAREDEVIMADSTSVNLFKLALAALRFQPGRTKIITDDLNFPSDLYILQSVVELAGAACQLVVVPSQDGICGNVAGLESAIDDKTALLSLSHTIFKSGYTYDMATVTEMAHRVGALVLWDTSHSVGAMPIELNQSAVDMAIGCSYKYLNGGPGAPAFLYVHRDLQDRLGNPISGWMGQKNPFDFELTYEPTTGLRRFLSGTPPILSLAASEIGIDMLLDAGIDNVRAKSIQQSEYFINMWERNLSNLGFVLKSPRDPSRRGSHVTLGHPEGWRIIQALIEDKNVIPDFRRPDNIRLGFAPLYNSFADVYYVSESLLDVLETGIYEKYLAELPEVT